MDHWLQNKAFQTDVLDEFLADVIVDELATVASVSMQEGKYKVGGSQCHLLFAVYRLSAFALYDRLDTCSLVRLALCEC